AVGVGRGPRDRDHEAVDGGRDALDGPGFLIHPATAGVQHMSAAPLIAGAEPGAAQRREHGLKVEDDFAHGGLYARQSALPDDTDFIALVSLEDRQRDHRLYVVVEPALSYGVVQVHLDFDVRPAQFVLRLHLAATDRYGRVRLAHVFHRLVPAREGPDLRLSRNRAQDGVVQGVRVRGGEDRHAVPGRVVEQPKIGRVVNVHRHTIDVHLIPGGGREGPGAVDHIRRQLCRVRGRAGG